MLPEPDQPYTEAEAEMEKNCVLFPAWYVEEVVADGYAGYVDETQTKALFEKLGRLMPPTTTIPASAVAEGKKKKTAKAKGAEGAFTGNAEENGAAPAGRSRETVIIDPREIEDMREWSAEIISLENEKRLTLAKINRLKDELKDLRKTVANYEGRISELGGKGYRGYKSGRLF